VSKTSIVIPPFGRRIAHDARDEQFLFQRPAKASKRTSRTWPLYWKGDQGNTPHCVGFGWAHWLAATPIVQWLDPHGIYGLALYLDEWEGEADEGTSVRAGAKVLQQLGIVERYDWAYTVDGAAQWLLEKGPVVFGLPWTEDMCVPDAKGLIRPTGEIAGGHCILANSVSTKTELIGLSNSWGTGWGIKGKCFIGFDDLHKLLRQDGEACLATERAAKVPK